MEKKGEIIKNHHEIPTNFVLTVIMLMLSLDLQYKIVIIEKENLSKRDLRGLKAYFQVTLQASVCRVVCPINNSTF